MHRIGTAVTAAAWKGHEKGITMSRVEKITQRIENERDNDLLYALLPRPPELPNLEFDIWLARTLPKLTNLIGACSALGRQTTSPSGSTRTAIAFLPRPSAPPAWSLPLRFRQDQAALRGH